MIPVLRQRAAYPTDAEGHEIVQPLACPVGEIWDPYASGQVEPAPGVWDSSKDEGHILATNVGLLDVTLELGDPVAGVVWAHLQTRSCKVCGSRGRKQCLSQR